MIGDAIISRKSLMLSCEVRWLVCVADVSLSKEDLGRKIEVWLENTGALSD